MQRSTLLGACALALLALADACGGGADTTTGTTSPPGTGTTGGTGSTGGSGTTAPTVALALAPATLTVTRGQSGTATVTITRSAGLTAAVTLSLAGAPAGVTGTFATAADGATATLTLAVAATAAPGAYALTVRGAATGGADASTPLALTVDAGAPAPFSIAVSATAFVAMRGTVLTHQPVVTITRDAGFTGAVSFRVTGLPATLAVGVSPGSTSASTAALVVVDAGTADGTYTATIHGTAAGVGEATTTVQIVVAPPSTGAITWRFCDNGLRTPVWFFAVRDGTGPWTRVVPSAGGMTFAFNLTQPVASVAMVAVDSGVAHTTVYQYTAQEIAAAGASECALYPGTTTRTAVGTATGLSVTTQGLVAMGGWFSPVTAASAMALGRFTLQNLPAGPLDLLAFRSTVDAQANVAPDAVILRRGLDPASGGTLAPLDFASTEAFAPATATWTFGNAGGEAFSLNAYVVTAGGTAGLPYAVALDRTAAARTVHGLPAARTVPGDLHEVIATVGTLPAGHATRQVVVYTRALADRAVDFGPALPAPNVTAASRAPVRIRAQGALPADYAAGVALDVKSNGARPRFATVYTTRGFLGAAGSYDVQMPDLTTALGWDSNWDVRAGDPTDWWVSGGGPLLDVFESRFVFTATRARWAGAATGVVAPADGATYRTARASGRLTP